MKNIPDKNTEAVLAWHWAANDLLTRHSQEEIAPGETLVAKGNIELCKNGMHASLDALDALAYAPGQMLCRVELSGEIIKGNDKLCARARKVLWVFDARELLHEFACLCAEHALARAKVTDPRSWGAIAAKRAWLRLEMSDRDLRDAYVAAYAAAHAAASAAAHAAASAAAHAAASAAASAAARAAHATARAAAYVAAYAAADATADAMAYAMADATAKEWQRETLSCLINELETRKANET